MNTIHVDVVSAEESIFSGEARIRRVAGRGRRAGHLPAPHAADHAHQARLGAHREGRRQRREFVFVAGGILEVQPNCVTVLSDTAIRGKDLDEEKANEAKAAAEEALRNAKGELDIAKAQSELAVMAAQIAALRKYRDRNK